MADTHSINELLLTYTLVNFLEKVVSGSQDLVGFKATLNGYLSVHKKNEKQNKR
jgi:hypothetical protein